MDLWLSQVNACDAVLSIANTTIHGSGGLNISTMCLLSVYSDWRWLIDPEVNTSCSIHLFLYLGRNTTLTGPMHLQKSLTGL